MRKKRSSGIFVLTLLSIVFFGYSLITFSILLPAGGTQWFVSLRYLLCALVSLVGLVASIFLFDIEKWARKLILYSCSFFLILGVITDISQVIIAHWSGVKNPLTLIDIVFNIKKFGLYIFWLAIIVFLNRPNVKKQFK